MKVYISYISNNIITLKKFKEKMGDPKESAILIGDFDQK
jgi:hypothetical protein